MISTRFKKRIFTPRTFREAANNAFRSIAERRASKRTRQLDSAFTERIMLAVTQVNGCRYCSYGHSRAALKAGVPSEEIRQLLAGELGEMPAKEVTALLFAEHYAETAGHPAPHAIQKLIAAYGEAAAQEILIDIRMIMIGNLLGNTFDALMNRITRKPTAEGSSIWNELGVILGAFWIMPAAAVRNLLLQPRRSPAR